MDSGRAALQEVAGLFLRLGATAFGGPAVHIAMMREEVVRRRRWMTDEEFLDLLGATNLIPGPNSTEMAIHIGYRRARPPSLLGGGAAVIPPAGGLGLGGAWAHVAYRSAPQGACALCGGKPGTSAPGLPAPWGLGRVAVRDVTTAMGTVAAFVLALAGVNEVGLLLVGGLGVMVVRCLTLPAAVLVLSTPAASLVPFSLGTLFWVFVKIGSVLFGSGYVLLAFLRADLVERLRWLSDQQLLDAVAVGQVTPGPVFTTATFVGYLLAGLPGALVATVGIFLPAFVFVAATHPFIPRLRRSPWAAAFLDGVNAVSCALMAAVTWQLSKASIVDLPTAVLAALSLVLVFRTTLNPALLLLAGAAAGVLVRVFVTGP